MIRLVKKHPSRLKTLEECKEKIEPMLCELEMKVREDKFVAQLRNEASIIEFKS